MTDELTLLKSRAQEIHNARVDLAQAEDSWKLAMDEAAKAMERYEAAHTYLMQVTGELTPPLFSQE